MISSSQRPLPDNTRHSQQTNIHAPGGIRTHDLSRRAACGRLCDELITRPEESYRLCCVVVCDLETSRMGAPYIYDISCLRVKGPSSLEVVSHRCKTRGKIHSSMAYIFIILFRQDTIHLFIHSHCSLSYDRSIASCKANSPQSAISPFQFPASSLFLMTSNCLRLLPRLPVTSILHYIFSSTARFRRQFLRKMCLIQFAFLNLTVRRIFLSSLTPCKTRTCSSK